MRMTVPPSVLELDRSGIASQPTEATKPRTRSGLLGFFRPQKTVSPLTHQAAQDVSVAVKKQTLAAGSCPARASRDPGDETEPCSAWSTLPEHLIESIMQMLQTNLPAPLHHNNKAERQVHRIITHLLLLQSRIPDLCLQLPAHGTTGFRAHQPSTCLKRPAMS